MFNKTIVTKLLKKNKGSNFIIATNIARGRGINGVEYKTFYEKHEWPDNSTYLNRTKFNNFKIVAIEEEYIEIKNHVKDAEYNSGLFTYYIPYESINSIAFVTE